MKRLRERLEALLLEWQKPNDLNMLPWELKEIARHTRQEMLTDLRNYLKEGVSLQVLKYNGAPVSLQLPQYVELAVVATELGMRGDTAAGGATKMATLETGLEARVPLFIKEGEIVRVNTQTGEVAGRA